MAKWARRGHFPSTGQDLAAARWTTLAAYCTVSVVEPAAPPMLAVTVATPGPLGYASPPG
jgi:hypothetical protein